jgi:hypothetical protein
MLYRSLIVMILLAASAAASTIVGSAAAGFNISGWNNGHAGRIDNNGTPYFDLLSEDGVFCNAGYYISGSSIGGTGCGNQPGGIDRFVAPNYKGPGSTTIGSGTDFWASTSSPAFADLSFNFASDSPTFVIELMIEASTNHTRNEFGLYSVDASGNPVATLVLFSGADGPGTQVAFTPGNLNFGFYVKNGSDTFFTSSNLNSTETSFQHFAAFRDPTDPDAGLANNNFQKLWIGVEDGVSNNKDFNDMIFALTCVSCGAGVLNGPAVVYAPEPGTFFIVAAGLALVGFGSIVRIRSR